MKRRIFTLVMVLAAVMTANAQNVVFGLKGGLDLQDMSFSEKDIDVDNRAGWFVGPTVQVHALANLSADIAALYDQKEYKVNDVTMKQKSILVPVNARLKFGIGSSAGIYVAAGPQFAFNIGDDKIPLKFNDSKDYAENKFQLKKSYLSINLGAGVYLSKHLEVGFAYNIPVGDTADATWKSAIDSATKKDDTKVKSWQVSLAYYF